MKATFKNIGPIKKAEMELGDLTIIAGQNNTGKTYLAYTLYGFLTAFDAPEYRFLSTGPNRDQGTNEKIQKIVEQIIQKGNVEINLSRPEYQAMRKEDMQDIHSVFSEKGIGQIFSSTNGEFQHAEFHMTPNNVESRGKMTGRITHPSKDTFLEYHLNSPHLKFKMTNPKNREMENDWHTRAVSFVFSDITRACYPRPFILSTERFGIALFYKEMDFTKNRLVEELQESSGQHGSDPFIILKKSSARYAKPIKDNIDFTRDLSHIQKENSGLKADKIRSVEAMVGGYYKVRQDEIRFISTKGKGKQFDIPIHLASSSARGLSDLYFYLKHRAHKGQLLIVDEPESHLSPANQILMARLLVFCVNAGLQVLVTTHSDYLIKEFNNLMILGGEFEGKESFLKHYSKDYSKTDCISPKVVKAYICEDGVLNPCTIDNQGMDMPVFDDVIDDLNEISNELYNRTDSEDLEDDD